MAQRCLLLPYQLLQIRLKISVPLSIVTHFHLLGEVLYLKQAVLLANLFWDPTVSMLIISVYVKAIFRFFFIDLRPHRLCAQKRFHFLGRAAPTLAKASFAYNGCCRGSCP